METYITDDNLFNYGGLLNIKDECKTYPIGDNWESALISIASFPSHFKIYTIQMEGQYIAFFSNTNPKRLKKDDNIWSDRYIRIAIFIENLKELHEFGYITGVKLVTEYDYKLKEYNDFLKMGYSPNKNDDIEIKTDNKIIANAKIPKPNLDEYLTNMYGKFDEDERNECIEDYKRDFSDYVLIDESIKLTNKGINKFKEIIQQVKIPKRFQEEINPLLKIDYHETAVREIAILIENMLKEFHNVNLYGENLIEFHIRKCVEANDGIFSAGLKLYLSHLKIHNQFIRNYYMHNKTKFSKENHLATIYKQSLLFNFMEQAFKKML